MTQWSDRLAKHAQLLEVDGTDPNATGGGGGSLTIDTFTGDGSDTTFTLSAEPTDGIAIVTVNGIQILPADYAISGTTLTFDTAPADEDEILVSHTTGEGGGGGNGEYAAKYNPDHETPSTTPAIAAEFNGALDASWVWTTAPTAVDYTSFPGYAFITSAAASNGALNRAWAPAGDCTLAMKLNFSWPMGNTTTHAFMLGFADTTGVAPTNFAGLYVTGYAISGVNRYHLTWITRGGGSWSTGTGEIITYEAGPPNYYRVTRTGTTINCYYSMDGIIWTSIASSTTKSLTIAQALVNVDGQAAMTSRIDWIRGWDSIVTKVGA